MIARNGGEYASNTSAQVMTFYEEYFQMNYKMPKMDSATIPSFTFGAMENWGLITYRYVFSKFVLIDINDLTNNFYLI